MSTTGTTGEVLWDSEDDPKMPQTLQEIQADMDTLLPVLDLGCGSGRRSLWLAQHFEQVIGVDVSQSAIDLAKRTYADVKNIHFDLLDITHSEAVEAFLKCHGEMNIYSGYRMHSVPASHLACRNIRLSACELYLSQVTRAIYARRASSD